MNLDIRFAIAGSAVMFVSMMVIGRWVVGEIEKGVTNNSAISAAMYMESFIAPLAQELAGSRTLRPATEQRLDKLISDPPLSERIASVKLWLPDGSVAYSNDQSLVNRHFHPTENLLSASRGNLVASFEQQRDREDPVHVAPGTPLMEVYSPIHSVADGRVIAVAEFYQRADELKQNLAAARWNSWLIVSAVALATFGLLFGIVRSGARVINRQHRELQFRLDERDRISRQNIELRQRIQNASSRSSEVQERFLRRISAELHDGPAQALALATLRFDSLWDARQSQGTAPGGSNDEIPLIRQALEQALRDIRNMCRGMTLPEIEGKSATDVLHLVVAAHEQLTNTSVARAWLAADLADYRPSHSTLICVYRFVQEGLMNAYRHAGAAGQTVQCDLQANKLTVSVSDSGPGFPASAQDSPPDGIGLQGLRERVESIGGKGTRLTMTLSTGD